MFKQLLKKTLKNQYLYYILLAILIFLSYFLYDTKIFSITTLSAIVTTVNFFIAGLGFALLLGYGGLASLGTAGFIALGCFGFHYLYNQVFTVEGTAFGGALLYSMLGVMILAAIVGIVFGFVSLRVSGIFLGIITMGLSQIILEIITKMPTFGGGGTSLPFFTVWLFNLKILSTNRMWPILFTAVFALIGMVIVYNLIYSPSGRALLAIKNSETVAQTMGISLIKYRLFAFVISGIFASIAGFLNYFFSRSGGVGDFGLSMSLNLLAAVVIGGVKSIWGVLIGTFFVFGLDLAVFSRFEFLRGFSSILTGVLIILVLMFYPGGLIQLFKDIIRWTKTLFKKIKEFKYGRN